MDGKKNWNVPTVETKDGDFFTRQETELLKLAMLEIIKEKETMFLLHYSFSGYPVVFKANH